MATNLSDLSFKTLWGADFEFRTPEGCFPEPVCLVAKEFITGEIIRFGEDELKCLNECPFDIGDNSLVVTYYGIAESSCFIALGWDLPRNHLDLFVEFRNQMNGLPTLSENIISPRSRYGLSAAMRHYGLPFMTTHHKEAMRDLIINNNSYTEEEKKQILDYCQEDVEALEKLLPKMLPSVRTDQALWRGEFMLLAAIMGGYGIPIDVDLYRKLKKHRSVIRRNLIQRANQDYGVFVGECFNFKLFGNYLEREKIPWSVHESGKLKTDKDTFKEMSLLYPQLENLRQIRKSLSVLKELKLPVGEDGRARCDISPFSSKTSRNQPSSNQFIFSLPSCLRGLIRPEPGTGLIYIDFRQQEFAIAAAKSGDPKMIEAYTSEKKGKKKDPYLAFGKQAGLIPPYATKDSHKKERDILKLVVLAVHYGMGADSLAQKLGCTPLEATHYLELHKQTYKVFWAWVEDVINHSSLTLQLNTLFGWQTYIKSPEKWRSTVNFPIQATGAEILRLACYFADQYEVQICAPVHDALLVEAPLDRLYETAAITHEAMRQAGEIVLNGMALETDIKLIRYPDHYQVERGVEIWNFIQQEIEKAENDGRHII